MAIFCMENSATSTSWRANPDPAEKSLGHKYPCHTKD